METAHFGTKMICRMSSFRRKYNFMPWYSTQGVCTVKHIYEFKKGLLSVDYMAWKLQLRYKPVYEVIHSVLAMFSLQFLLAFRACFPCLLYKETTGWLSKPFAVTLLPISPFWSNQSNQGCFTVKSLEDSGLWDTENSWFGLLNTYCT